MLEFKDLRVDDIIGKEGPDGELWTVIWACESKAVIQRSTDLMDLTGWEKINLYGTLSKTSRGEPIGLGRS